MDIFKKISFVRFCFASATFHENLGLSKEQLIRLYKECTELAKHCNDSSTMVNSCVQFVSLSNSISRQAESLSYLKEILPTARKIPCSELVIYKYMSITHEELKEYEKSISHAEKWIQIARKIGDNKREMEGCLSLGKAYLFLGLYGDAIEYGTKCLHIAQAIGSKSGEMYAYNCMRIAYKMTNKINDTISYAQKYLDIALETGSKMDMKTAYLELGRAHLSVNHYEDAIVFGKKCIEIAKEIDDKDGEVWAHLLMGRIYDGLRKYDDAISYCKKCIEMSIQCGNKYAEPHAYSLLGSIYHSLESYDDAILYSRKSIAIVKESNDEKAADVVAYLTLGKVYKSLKRLEVAVQNFKECITFADQIDREKEAKVRAYWSLGEIYHSMKLYEDAVSSLKKGIDMAQETGEKLIEAEICLELSDFYQSLEKKGEALIYSKKCLDASQEHGEKRMEAKACRNLAGLYFVLKDKDKAIFYGKKCVDISKECCDRRNETEGHFVLAQIYQGFFQLNDVSFHIDEGVAIAKELEDEKAQENFTVIRCSFYATVGMLDKVKACNVSSVNEWFGVPTCSEKELLEAVDQAMKTSDQLGKHTAFCKLYKFYHSNHNYEKVINCLEKLKELDIDCSINAFCFTEIGESYVLMFQYDKALQCFKEGLPEVKTCTDKMQQSNFFYRFGKLYCFLNRELELAEEYLREAIRYFEVIFLSLGSQEEFKISIFDKYVNCYKLLTVVLIKTKPIEQALLVSDRCRARTLKDLLISNFGLKQEASDEESLEYSDIESLASRHDLSILYYSVCFNTLLTFSFGAKKELQFSFQTFEIKEVQQHLVDKAFDLMGVRDVVNCEDRALDTEQDDEKRQKRNEDESIGLTDRLQKPSSLLRQLILDSRRGAPKEYSDESERFPLDVLFCKLISDCKFLMEQEEIVIIPDGPLYRVPFTALRDPDTGRYLSETKRIRLAPSLATLKHLEEFPADQNCKTDALIVGDPFVDKVIMDGEKKEFAPLEGAREEAADIAYILNVRPLLRNEATKPAVLKRLQQGASIVHIAAHGILSKASIVLAPSPEIRATKIPDEKDYMLTMADVQEAQVRAQLVVLSCCHSGRGEIRAEGVVGMCRAFLASGARAVVASLWAVSDNATLKFMKKFYKHLKKGNSASTSLHLTMNDMRQNPRYSEPKYWAPFFLMVMTLLLHFNER